MKSSLKFTAIALLLGGVLQVQNLNAAASDAINYDLAINPFAESVSRIFASHGTPREFATSIEGLSRAPTNTNQEKRLLLYTLVDQVIKSELPLTFFEEAFADDSKAKVFMAACIGAKRGSISIRGLREELDVLTSKLGKRTDEIDLLQDEVNELSDGIEWLQRDANNLSSALDQAQQILKSLHAFAQPSEQSVAEPVSTLPTYTVVKPEPSTLPVAEQLYLLKIRSKLASQEDLTASLTDLETLLRFRQLMAITDRSDANIERAAFLVDTIPQIRAIAPTIGRYLQSITGDILKINATATSGWFTAPQLGAVETLKLKELEIRKNLAYATFDALFGTMTKPATIPAAVDFRTDPGAANVLAKTVQTLHATLPATVPSQKVVVKNDGLVAVTGDAGYATEVNLSLQFMIDLQQLTVDFLTQTYGAQTLLQTTLKTSAVIGETELVQAMTMLCPPPAPLAAVQVDTGSDANHLDTSSHSEEGALVELVTEED